MPGDAPRAASASFLDARARSGTRIGSFTFSARQRLRDKTEFDHVYRSGQRCAQTFFQAAACSNSCGFARLGLSIAARTVGNSVARNRIRRIVREVFRLRQRELPAFDIVVSARPRARTATAPELREDLARLFVSVAALSQAMAST